MLKCQNKYKSRIGFELDFLSEKLKHVEREKNKKECVWLLWQSLLVINLFATLAVFILGLPSISYSNFLDFRAQLFPALVSFDKADFIGLLILKNI